MTFSEIAMEVAAVYPQTDIRASADSSEINSMKLGLDCGGVPSESCLFVLTGEFPDTFVPPAEGAGILCVGSALPPSLAEGYNLILVPSPDMISPVFNLIESLLHRRESLNAFLHSALTDNSDIHDLANRVAKFMGNPLVISDMNSRIVTMSDDNVNDSAWMRFRELGYLPYHADIAEIQSRFMDGVKHGNTVLISDGKHKPGYVMQAALMTGNVMVGHISVYSFYREFSEKDAIDIKVIAGLLAIKVVQGPRINPEIQSASDYFISELVKGNFTDDVEIESRLMFLQWQLRRHIYLMIVRWDGLVLDMDQMDIHSRTFRRLLPDAHTATIDDSLVVIFSRDDTLDEKSDLFKTISDELARISAHGILSSQMDGLKKTHIVYEKSRIIFDINLKIGRREILQRTDMGVLELMFYTIGSKYPLIDFCHPMILKLQQYDRDNDSELTKCLEAYICTGRNFGRAAERLFTHRNTVIYRIAKISELLGFDFQREETVMHFELSFCILNYMKCMEGKQKFGEK